MIAADIDDIMKTMHVFTKTMQFLFLLGIFGDVSDSVIFPYGQNGIRSQRTRFKDHGGLMKKNERLEYHYKLKRQPSKAVGGNGLGMVNNFDPVKSGGALFLGAAAIRLMNLLRSEVFSRALYFWIHAGPIVVHYKFTRWFLAKTNAPLESETYLSSEPFDRTILTRSSPLSQSAMRSMIRCTIDTASDPSTLH